MLFVNLVGTKNICSTTTHVLVRWRTSQETSSTHKLTSKGGAFTLIQLYPDSLIFGPRKRAIALLFHRPLCYLMVHLIIFSLRLLIFSSFAIHLNPFHAQSTYVLCRALKAFFYSKPLYNPFPRMPLIDWSLLRCDNITFRGFRGSFARETKNRLLVASKVKC